VLYSFLFLSHRTNLCLLGIRRYSFSKVRCFLIVSESPSLGL